MPNGHLSRSRQAGCMPGGYSLQANFLELRIGEVRILGILRSSAQGGSQKSAEPRPKTYERPRLISAYFGY
jgi:hypothetical protein